jgi:tRNA(Ile)-lysidine synthase
MANKFLIDNAVVKNEDLLALPRAILRRVLVLMSKKNLSESLLSDLVRCLELDNFCYNIGEGLVFVSERGICKVISEVIDRADFSRELDFGSNVFADQSSEIIISEEKLAKSFTNVYKISIQHDLSSAIINGRLCVRQKKDGDTVCYGGITRKLKKLFSDRKIPKDKRDLIPIICDDSGVVCVPGYGVRDDGVKDSQKKLFLTVGISSVDNEYRFYIGSEFRT